MIERLMLGLAFAAAAWWIVARNARPDPNEWWETESTMDRIRRNGL
jgi:hypothetical protein